MKIYITQSETLNSYIGWGVGVGVGFCDTFKGNPGPKPSQALC